MSVPALDIRQDFGFTEEHELLAKDARRFLDEHASPERRREQVENEHDWDSGLWQRMSELGWLGLVVPETRGGSGLGWLHVALLLEQTGRSLLTSPLLPHTLATTGIALGGSDAQQARYLPSLVSGDKLGTLACDEPGGGPEPTDVAATVTFDGDGYRLHGTKAHVMAAQHADVLLVPARESDQTIRLFLIELPAEGVRIEPEQNVDLTRRTARVELHGARVPADARLERGGTDAVEALWARGRLMLSAEMIGAAEAALLMTRDYAAERVQFDRPIGAFQAVKHPIVDALVYVEQGRSLTYGAASALDDTTLQAPMTTRMAKATATDALDFATRKGVQLHGGFGFTWEADIHFYLRRAMWARPAFGDAMHQRRHLAEGLLGRLEGS